MTPQRIALISSSHHPYTGGVEEHVRNVARELTARGHLVEVWTVDRGEQLGIQDVDGVAVHYLPTPLPSRSVRGVWRFVLGFPAATLAWCRTFRAFGPDVLHVQCFGPNGLYAAVLARLSATTLVVSTHGETFADDHAVFDESALLRAGFRRALKSAVLVTGCSQVVLDDLKARFGFGGGIIVPNGVDLDEAPPPTSLGEPPMVFAVGRLERMKGFDLLIAAFSQADLPPGTRLVIGGDGGAMPLLQQQVEELSLADKVVLPGRLSRQDVAGHMARASVVVVPSRREAFGIVVLEAWRAGAPVIATSHGGPADLVANGVDGLVVDPEDIAGLAAAISTLLRDREFAVQLGSEGGQTVQSFTWGHVVDLYEAAYFGSLGV